MLEKSFNKVRRENPYLSDLVCFNLCLMGKKFCKTDIRKYFKKLVSKDDYQRKQQEKLIDYAISLTL